MKVLFIIDHLYLHGGAEKVLAMKANYLCDVMGKEVSILTFEQKGKNRVYEFSDKIKFVDLDVDYVRAKSYFHPRNILRFPSHFFKLKKEIRRIKPDVIVSCNYGPDFLFLPSIQKHIPKIKEFHSSRIFSGKKQLSLKEKLVQRLNENVERKYDQLVLLNEDEKEFYHSNKITVIPNPAELSGYQANLSCKRILAAGRISPVKNFSELIDIFSKVASDFPDWELHIYGEDYLGTQQKLQNQIELLNLSDRVKLMGITTDMKRTMQNYSIYAMTSETECFPMVLLEALSVGLPIISYDSPTGPRHILTDESDSFIVPYKNLDIFAEKLQKLMSNENLRKQMSENAKENAERFESSMVMLEWKNLFKTITLKS